MDDVLYKKKKTITTRESLSKFSENWDIYDCRNEFVPRKSFIIHETALESFVKGCPIDLEPKTMTAAACHLSALQPVSRTVSHGAKQRRNEVGREREKKGTGGDSADSSSAFCGRPTLHDVSTIRRAVTLS